MVSGPRNGARVSRDRRPRRLAVVAGRPPAPRDVLRIARPVQHDVDGASAAPNGGSRYSRMRFTSSRRSGSSTRQSRLCATTLIARDAKPWRRSTRHQILRAAAIVLALVVVAGAWPFAVPYAVAREALTYGGAATIAAGPRDRWFFADGWSGLVVEGNVTMRFAANSLAQRSESFCPSRDRTG